MSKKSKWEEVMTIENMKIPKTDWWEEREYRFYRMPKSLFADPIYQELSGGAIMLYTVLLDRLMLSAQNDWRDDNDEVFLRYSNRNLCELLHWSHDKVSRMMKELEAYRLIRRRKHGQGKPDDIYILPFSEVCDISDGLHAENQNSKVQKTGTPEPALYAPNETKKNDTKENETDSSIYREEEGMYFFKVIKGNIDYDILSEYSADKKGLEELVSIIEDVCCGLAPTVRIGSDSFPRRRVVERLLQLDAEHMEYVLDKLKKETTEVYNFRAYALTLLYNAPSVMKLETDREIRRLLA